MIFDVAWRGAGGGGRRGCVRIFMLGVAGVLEAGVWRGAGCYGGGVVSVVRVLRRCLRVLGGSPAAARRAWSAWRVFQARRMRWLRMVCRQASQSASGVRPMRRHQPRLMVLVAGSLM